MTSQMTDNTAPLTYPHANLSGGIMGNRTLERPNTLRRTIARSALGAVGVTGTIAGGLLLALDHPNLRHDDAFAAVALGLAVIALTAWLLPRANVASDAQIMRWTLVVMVPLLVIGLYATLAVMGRVPAASWSPLG